MRGADRFWRSLLLSGHRLACVGRAVGGELHARVYVTREDGSPAGQWAFEGQEITTCHGATLELARALFGPTWGPRDTSARPAGHASRSR